MFLRLWRQDCGNGVLCRAVGSLALSYALERYVNLPRYPMDEENVLTIGKETTHFLELADGKAPYQHRP